MTARAITAALPGGRWHGHYGMARCPCHEDRNPSLSISDGQGGRLLVNCFSGCDPVDILRALNSRGLSEPSREPPAPRLHRRDNGRAALDIWHESLPAPGTLVERYLRRRGISLPVPPSIRYHPGLRHGPTGLILPAMVAAVQAPDRRVCAIHRTFLTEFGGKAGVLAPKMALGPLGAGAVRLAKAGPLLGLAEGIETALSAMEITGTPCWAALSATRLSRVAMPPGVRAVTLFADNGEAGERAAREATAAYRRQGKAVTIQRPPQGSADWNDTLNAMEAAS